MKSNQRDLQKFENVEFVLGRCAEFNLQDDLGLEEALCVFSRASRSSSYKTEMLSQPELCGRGVDLHSLIPICPMLPADQFDRGVVGL